MGVQGRRVLLLCQADGCQAQAKQKCRLCAQECCSVHGHWVKAGNIGTLRGPTPSDASIWLCARCAEKMRLAVPPDPRRGRRPGVDDPLA